MERGTGLSLRRDGKGDGGGGIGHERTIDEIDLSRAGGNPRRLIELQRRRPHAQPGDALRQLVERVGRPVPTDGAGRRTGDGGFCRRRIGADLGAIGEIALAIKTLVVGTAFCSCAVW